MSVSVTELVERDAELDGLTEALTRTEQGAGGVLALIGEAGVGKSALLRTCISAAHARGFTVLSARSGELEQDHVFGALRRLAVPAPERGASTGLGRVVTDTLDAAPEGLDRNYGVAHRLSGELALAAEAAPVLLCLDDAHWADPASLRVLHYLGARAEGQRLLLALGIRSGESADLALMALAEPPATVLRPAPLSLEGAARLIAATAGTTVSEEVVHECHRASAGNPYFVVELARALIEGPDADGLPISIGEYVRARLARRSEAGRRTAAALAVLGDAPPVHHLTALTGESAEAVLEAGVELARAGILGSDRALTFAHPLVAQAVRSDLDPNQRALSHQRAADLLVADGASAAQVAAHLLHTVPAGRVQTVQVLLEAAAAATARGAAGTAVPLLRRALAEPPAIEDRGALLAGLGTAELEAGSLTSALEHLNEGLGLARSPVDLTHRAIALALATTVAEGMPAAAVVLDTAIQRLPEDEDRLRLELEAHAIRLSLFDARLYERGWRRLGELPEPPAESPAGRAILALKAMREVFFGGTAAEAGRLARLACTGGRLAEDPGFDSIPFGIAMSAACEAGDLEFAMQELDRAVRRARSRNAPGDLAVILGARALVDHRRGDLRGLDETVALARMGLNAASGSHLAVALAPLLGAAESVIRADTGDPRGTDEALASGGLLGPVEADPNAQRLLGWRVRGHLALGRYVEARADIEGLREHQADSGIEWDPSAPWRAWLAQVEAVEGDHGRARELAEYELVRAAHWGSAYSRGMSTRARAHAEAGAESIDWFRQAADAFGEAGDAVEHARAQIDLGQVLGRFGQVEEARDRLSRGMDAAAAAGATGLVARARKELVRTGARPRRDRISGIDGLTGAERRVAAMAASGLANREIAQSLFVSIKTVEGHLRAAYAKLGVSQRSELRALWSAERT